MGRRLGEYTKDNTKCMVPVNGVRLIDRLLAQLAKQNLNRIIIVVGYKGKEFRAGFCPCEALSRGTLFPELVSDYPTRRNGEV